jgi:hypothetical protein
VERVAFNRRPFDRFVEKAEIECGVVANQYGPLAAIVPDGATHFAEYALQSIPFVDCRPQWMMRVDAVYSQGRRIHIGALEWPHVVSNGLATRQDATVAKVDQHGGNLKQCVSLRVETAGLDIHNDGQEAAKPVCHGSLARHLALCLQDLLVE